MAGADSGIGRSVAVHFAREGAAGVVVCFHTHTEDAEETKRLVVKEGARCTLISGDVGDSSFCNKVVDDTIKEYGRIDVLVNNAAEQHPADDITTMDPERIQRTFRTNIYSQIFLCRAAWPHLKRGASIINTSSVNAYAGHSQLLDYTATKGAITAFTRAMHMMALSSGIRVNSVAPGPIWTPLIPATFPEEKVKSFGSSTPLGRAGQPSEVAPSYVFLASEDSSYISGQSLHPNGGRVVNA
ncbi:hypothetical protein VOLCADRAFT_94638 [Volvox carteri f. nagariensis]|uniref:Uncharacterized protein n=1 Tax=Volvox carteri f. nagariensis TaxID=3068 RepID=D8U5B6_VOLCA|nr:uncharacterized protein VOLCADRAFT_94638 [Volvox carteri f. nagariensis]EFJ45122.1 hypothetical protein VOLCADRAFT_94638 [Volvox carteri f. nagariensis]|eukprot:XP_002953798.1 hypothetical protein VOLCADRAFT_94638 [Volvox carteri f. nagariensis]